MNEKQSELIETVMEMIDGTIHTMELDEFHAPAKWVLENWWHTLNAVLAIKDTESS